MADFEQRFIFPFNGHKLNILYRASKWDGEYHGASYIPYGAKTLAFIDSLSDEEYEKIWDEMDVFAKKFNFPY